jgi:hypothetical protein
MEKEMGDRINYITEVQMIFDCSHFVMIMLMRRKSYNI